MEKRPVNAYRTTGDIVNISTEDFYRLTEPELRMLTRRLQSTVNKRVKAFERNDMMSPALRSLESGGKISTKGKDLRGLRKEFIRARNFLESSTGSVTAWRQVQKDTINTLKSRYGISINPKQFDDFWSAYERLKETNPEVANRNLKYKVLSDVAESTEAGASPDQTASVIASKMGEIYEQLQENAPGGDISDFFPIE